MPLAADVPEHIETVSGYTAQRHALAVVLFGHASGLASAFVSVGFSIATANGRPGVVAHHWLGRAPASAVAVAGGFLTEERPNHVAWPLSGAHAVLVGVTHVGIRAVLRAVADVLAHTAGVIAAGRTHEGAHTLKALSGGSRLPTADGDQPVTANRRVGHQGTSVSFAKAERLAGVEINAHPASITHGRDLTRIAFGADLVAIGPGIGGTVVSNTRGDAIIADGT